MPKHVLETRTINGQALSSDLTLTTSTDRSVYFTAPSASVNATIWKTQKAVTITSVNVVVRGTSPSVTYVINYGASRATADGTIVASATVTANGNATLNTTSIPINNYVWITTSAVSGTIDEFYVQVNFNQ